MELERKLAAMAGWAVGTLLCGGCRPVGGVGEGMVGIVGFAVEFVGLGNVDGTVISGRVVGRLASGIVAASTAGAGGLEWGREASEG